MAVAFGVAFTISWVIYKEDNEEKSTDKNNEKQIKNTEQVVIDTELQPTEEIKLEQGEIISPLAGRAIPMSQVNDSTFSAEILGKGMAVLPTEGKVYSPVNGKIVTVFDTKHAVGIESEDGTEILIHIGINTVELKGEGFTSCVLEGQKVKAGQLLVEFDIPKIKEAGYDITTPVIITNTYDYKNVKMVCGEEVKYGDKVIQCSK